jgi:2-polyprenyl-6-methoxyphenol hydroxylase-like FAD-dependent oxidoreductase
MTMPFDALRDRLLERYQGWCAPSESFIASTEAWLRTAIHDVPRLPTWHRGPVLILGDAAHAMSPAGGQGASLALEDARIFAQLVATLPVEDAMPRFESLRRARAEKVVAQGYANDRRSLQEHGAVGMWMRDRIFMPMFSSFIERGLHQLYTADANE